jgi:transposase
LIAVIEMSQASWLVGALVPGVERHPLKKLTRMSNLCLRLLQRWPDEVTTGRPNNHAQHGRRRG